MKTRPTSLLSVTIVALLTLATGGEQTFAQTRPPRPVDDGSLPYQLYLPAVRRDLIKQKGVAYTDWSADTYSTSNSDQSLAVLRNTGADWISLLVTQYQDTITSTTIFAAAFTPTDTALIHAINRAHSLGLKVMLKPHIDLAADPNQWRGQIGQGFSDTDWSNWFAAYQAFINHYAQLAQAHGVEQFSAGTELSATDGQEIRWRSTIASIRSIYSGPITYASNWGTDSLSLTWWDAVDTIGVDAYYPLTNKADPTLAELKSAWSPYVADLGSLASQWNKPILLTEIGYRSQSGTNMHPWDWQVGGTIDLQEQANCYQAALETLYDQPWFAGMYWWAWSPWPNDGGPNDEGYSPRDKPAGVVLTHWY